MKKFLIATVVLLGSITLANAEQYRVGVSVMGAAFEADGAQEIFSGDHSSNTTSTKVTKKSSAEKENAAILYQALKKGEELILKKIIPVSNSTERVDNLISTIHAIISGTDHDIQIDYLDIRDFDTFKKIREFENQPMIIVGAIYYKKIRLIDNIIVNP